MTDVQVAQLATVCMSLGLSFLAVLIGTFLNNKRLDDIKTLLLVRIEALEKVLTANLSTVAPAKDLYELRVVVEKNHSEMMLKFTETDNRLSRIENERERRNG